MSPLVVFLLSVSLFLAFGRCVRWHILGGPLVLWVLLSSDGLERGNSFVGLVFLRVSLVVLVVFRARGNVLLGGVVLRYVRAV